MNILFYFLTINRWKSFSNQICPILLMFKKIAKPSFQIIVFLNQWKSELFDRTAILLYLLCNLRQYYRPFYCNVTAQISASLQVGKLWKAIKCKLIEMLHIIQLNMLIFCFGNNSTNQNRYFSSWIHTENVEFGHNFCLIDWLFSKTFTMERFTTRGLEKYIQSEPFQYNNN